MKSKNLIYILSIVFLIIAMLLLIEFPESGRYSLIAGFLTSFGLVLNVVAYKLKSKNILNS